MQIGIDGGQSQVDAVLVCLRSVGPPITSTALTIVPTVMVLVPVGELDGGGGGGARGEKAEEDEAEGDEATEEAVEEAVDHERTKRWRRMMWRQKGRGVS